MTLTQMETLLTDSEILAEYFDSENISDSDKYEEPMLAML